MTLKDREYARLHRMDPEPDRHTPKPRYWIFFVVCAFIVIFVFLSWPNPILKNTTPWGHIVHEAVAKIQQDIDDISAPYHAAEKKVLTQ